MSVNSLQVWWCTYPAVMPGGKYMGTRGDFAPEMQKEPWKMSKEPPKIPIDTM